MRRQAAQFTVRWLANCLGLVLAGGLFGLLDYGANWTVVLCGGFVLAVLNALVKPLLVIVTLPAIALSLGLFTIVINGIIVYLAGILYGPLVVDSFWAAVLAGMLIGLVNYIVNMFLEVRQEKHDKYF